VKKRQQQHMKNIMTAMKNKKKRISKMSYDKIKKDAVSPNGGVQPFGFDKTANTILSSNQKKKKFRF
tara:strand:- start:745 stop:945 length:201 start_codon:yes stop_codon:yes gene_type:complete